jgi:spermidine synthase
VYEIDAGVVDIDVERLGARLSDDLRVMVQDGRTGIRSEPDRTYDVVVGDAFGGPAVPWHLTTRELVADVRRVLRPGGIYAVNLIDFGELAFARAEVRTVRAEFPHIAVLSRRSVLGRTGSGGNIVVVGSDEPLPVERIRAELDRRETGWDLLGTDEELDRFVGDAPLLTDDFAPVDQLLTPYGET